MPGEAPKAMSKLQTFLSATERCVIQCKAMLAFEQEKRQALLSDDLDRLESMIQAQQAAVMKLESLEKQRVEAQDEAGYREMNADEILEKLGNSPDKATLARQVDELKQTLQEIRYQNDRSLEIARANLQVITALATGSEQNERQGVYRPGTSAGTWQAGTSGSSFETKI